VVLSASPIQWRRQKFSTGRGCVLSRPCRIGAGVIAFLRNYWLSLMHSCSRLDHSCPWIRYLTNTAFAHKSHISWQGDCLYAPCIATPLRWLLPGQLFCFVTAVRRLFGCDKGSQNVLSPILFCLFSLGSWRLYTLRNGSLVFYIVHISAKQTKRTLYTYSIPFPHHHSLQIHCANSSETSVKCFDKASYENNTNILH